MRHTSYDELIWTCQDSLHIPFMSDLNEYLKLRKARPVLIKGPGSVPFDPDKDPDISVLTDHSCVFFAIDFPWQVVPMAKYFDNREDSPFNSDWQMAGILVTKFLDRFEIVQILKGWSDDHKVIWPDVPLEYLRKDGKIEVSLSSVCPTRELYVGMRDKLDEQGKMKLDAEISCRTNIYHLVRQFCESFEGKKLLVVEPKPPKLIKRSKTRIKVNKRGHMGYITLWEQQPKPAITTTPIL